MSEDKTNENDKGKKNNVGAVIGGVLGFSGLAAAGAAAGSAAFFYDFSLTPKKHDVRNDRNPSEKDYVAGRRWMHEHPLRRDLYITSGDGLLLHANYIPSADKNCHRYAICVHGYADTSESMGLYARHYYDVYGMNVLLPDLRGHGGSEGDYVGMGLHDSKDIARWITRITQMDLEAVIILHGISMGAATVLMTTGRELPDCVKAAVSDASYTSAYEEFKFVYGTLPNTIIPADVMMEMVRAITRVRAHYDLRKAAPVDAVKTSKTPTLFIHGDADDFVPSNMMPQIYEAAACRKKFAWFSGAKHVQSVVREPEGYWNTVDHFLDRISPDILHDSQKTDQ